jgi:hypothetical protein
MRVCAAAHVLVGVLVAYVGLGTTPTSAADPAQLEARIRALEKRLQELEAKGSKRSNEEQPSASSSIASQSRQVHTSDEATNELAADKSKTKKGGEPQQRPPTENATSTQAALLISDKAPTLEQNKAELSFESQYTRSTGFLQKDRVFTGIASARYGIAEGWEVSAIVPYYMTTRETQTLGNLVTYNVESFGDVGLQVTKSLWKPGKVYPGAALLVGVSLPTGESPFVFGASYVAGGDPRKFFESIQSRGLWGANTNLQFFQLYDPVIIFFGIGLDKAFSDEIEGHSVDPGLRYLYNAGMSMALSEHTTLGFQVSGAFEEALYIDDQKVGAKNTEQIRSRFVVIQRVADQLFVEPSVAVGLTKDSSDVTLGVGLRKRF